MNYGDISKTPHTSATFHAFPTNYELGILKQHVQESNETAECGDGAESGLVAGGRAGDGVAASGVVARRGAIGRRDQDTVDQS